MSLGTSSIFSTMREKIFRFKQFTVSNDKSAMKVGTDGVLLGAWCSATNALRVLDVGTGTGLIALMVAQRNESAIIEAVEIDEDACKEAELNFNESRWSDRLTAVRDNFIDFTQRCNVRYDLIVSNPPFYTEDILPSGLQRKQARHCSSLSYKELIESSLKILSDDGIISFISPVSRERDIQAVIDENNLHIIRRLTIYPKPGADAKRIIWEISRMEKPTTDFSLTIEHLGRHEYTDEYIALTKAFYLNM